MSPRVVVFDYGSGNLRSAQRALVRAGAEVTVTADAAQARQADGLVLPGVGAFAACARQLADAGGDAVVRDRVSAGRPVLGICVGMQVLCERGDEHGVRTAGLGLLPGVVRRLRADVVPHMGWNTVTPPAGSMLFAGIAPATRFYFVHSFAAPAPAQAGTDGVSVAEHGEPFVAAMERGPVAATQFHPEKSGEAGAALLANWVGSLR